MHNNLVTKQIIVDGLKELGLTNGDAVLVHSSLASFGHVDGGADTVIGALLETVGADGTVLVPTLTGSADLSASNPPVFDVRSDRCWTGTIPETVRVRADALRSLHPTHSVAAIGPNPDNSRRARLSYAMHLCAIEPPRHQGFETPG